MCQKEVVPRARARSYIVCASFERMVRALTTSACYKRMLTLQKLLLSSNVSLLLVVMKYDIVES